MTGENTGQPERIAVCLNCSNEWIPRNPAAKKLKCPICGKYRYDWKDELSEKKPDFSDSPGEIAGENTGEKEKTQEKKEKRQEKKPEPEDPGFLPEDEGEEEGENEEGEKDRDLQAAMKKAGGLSPVMVIGGVVVLAIIAGIGYFLSGRSKGKIHRQITPANPQPVINPRVQNVIRRLS